ncbi:MAG TPA: hypothetical protein PLJ27_04405 [Polyangiaceae bacterium]|jgi:hypothetical protein|nr:MAG: hypothetical protein BWY17_02342 [Deltaproteobacteria bacterium ADurb.Bin207]HNS99008.1 hypothetical protein [Polyangiaceae bacterium]HNZ23132.1 hypothetical protein [Polyangiaceae bacterium]HOD22137.1 hypothetical protein [Polyangiaceae bacterium]HOE49413.1 hypothetical protein [Polyangiaceae bacterium]
MGTELVLCSQCGRHIRNSEETCPFCSSPRVAMHTGMLAAAVTAVMMGGCGPGPVAVYGPPPQSANPPTSEQQRPSPSDQDNQGNADQDGDRPEYLEPPVAVYGPPPDSDP